MGRTYGIVDGNGTQITTGLQEHNARETENLGEDDPGKRGPYDDAI